VLSELPPKAVRKVVYTKSAKGMVAVTWKAGLSAGFGTQLQGKLLRLAASKVLNPMQGDHPLSVAEMEWQLEFFGAGE
jgi:hypothetical protein